MRGPHVFVKIRSQKNRVTQLFSQNSNIAPIAPKTVFPVLYEYLVLGSSKEKSLTSLTKISTSKSGNRAFDQN